jgi:hypothetical protein
LGAGNVENGHMTAVQGRKITTPCKISLPEKAKGDGRGLSFQTMSDEMDASIIRIGVNIAPDWYSTQSIT